MHLSDSCLSNKLLVFKKPPRASNKAFSAKQTRHVENVVLLELKQEIPALNLSANFS